MNRATDGDLEACPCCESKVIGEPGAYEICEVCNWEDDPIQSADPTCAGGANRMSLVQARIAWNGQVTSPSDEQIQVGFPGHTGTVERLWATHVRDDLYRLDNAPAFAFGVSLHDVVEVFRDEHGAAWALRVVERGPVSTVRVALDELEPRSLRLMRMLASIGCSCEGMHATWFVVSAHDEASFALLIERLATEGYRWEYVNPKRQDVPSPHPSAATERLVPPEVDGSRQALLHLDAPWMDRADDELLVLAVVNPEKKRAELLPARQLDGTLWELCCSPFLADDLALGDIVEADESRRLLRRVSRSGRAAMFAFVPRLDEVEGVSASLLDLGCAVERRRQTGTLSVNCATPDIFDRAHAWLAARPNITFEVLQPPRRPGEPSRWQLTIGGRRATRDHAFIRRRPAP